MDRMDLVARVVGEVRYKPSATISWQDDCFVVRDRLRDADTGRVRVFEWCSGPPWRSIMLAPDDTEARQLVLEWVFDNLAMHELHEAAEWMRVDGRAYFDPHAEEHDNMVKIGLSFPSGEGVDMKVIP